jgi:NADH dehydrogenase
MAMQRHVTVFGGTGFLGQRIVAALAARGLRVRIAARHPDSASATGASDAVRADLRDAASIRAALDGATAAVNAVSLYAESRDLTFQTIHVEGAGLLAEAAAAAGLDRLVHISGIGADARSRSAYVRSRGEGEEVVRAGFSGATIFRPSAMFGPGDALLTTLIDLVRRLPIVPLFGDGSTRLQPVHVENVAAAVAAFLAAADQPAPNHELGGPQIFSYRSLLELVMQHVGRRRALAPVPFPVWDSLAALSRVLPSPPLTEGQVALMKQDNVADPGLPGLSAVGIRPITVETEIRRRMERHEAAS